MFAYEKKAARLGVSGRASGTRPSETKSGASSRKLALQPPAETDAPVQRLEGGSRDGAGVLALAQRGLEGPGGRLPHVDRIQAAFGEHDVGGIGAHVGGAAAEASDAIGARAYASGEEVAFRGSPDLRTAAHEAAHVVQQRSGVRPAGGVGRRGDAFEQRADAVAARVVAGRSAESLLGPARPAGGARAGAAVQRDDGEAKTDAPPVKETQWNAKLDTSKDTLIQAFDSVSGTDKVGWNLDVLTAKIAIGLKSSAAAWIEVIGNWQPDVSQGTSSELQERAAKRAATVRKALAVWGNFDDKRLRSRTQSMSMDGTAKAGSFRDVEVWFRTGAAAPPATSYVPPLGSGGYALPPTPPPGVGAPAQPTPLKPGTTPADAVKRIKDLNDLIAAAGEAATKDKLVKELRDFIVKIQFVMSDDEMKKTLDDAIKSGMSEGAKAVIKAAFEALTKKSATEMPAERTPQLGPAVAPKDLNEKILKSPEFKLDKVPELKRGSFEIRGVKLSYKASTYVDLTVLTPDDFEPYGWGGAAYLVTVSADDFTKNAAKAEPITSKQITSKGSVKLSILAPDKPGDYQVAVRQDAKIETYTARSLKIT